jgi:AcrR family transcriptional regulator
MNEPARSFALADPGPRRLRREEVASSQRARLLRAMAEVAAEKGYANTVVADVIARAGVSRRTFYELFRDKQDCFLAAYAETVDLLSSDVVAAVTESPPDATTADVLDRILSAYLGLLASEPLLAKTYLVEVYAAGPEAIAKRRAFLDRFTELILALHAELARRGEPVGELDPFDAEALVAAISMLVTTRVAAGEAEALPELRERLRQFLLDHLLVRR